MAWGTSITTKFYLNTHLKAIDYGNDRDLYPVYVRIICKQQVSQFKYFGPDLEPLLYSKKDFDRFFGPIDLNNDDQAYQLRKGVAVSMIASFKENVEFLIEWLNAFERTNFSLKRFPQILKNYFELDRRVLRIGHRALMNGMVRDGYEGLLPIIDWVRHKPDDIHAHLLLVQRKLGLPDTKVDHPALPFSNTNQLLTILKSLKLSASQDTAIKSIMKEIDSKAVKDYGDLVSIVVGNAVRFQKEAFKLSSR